MDGVRAVRVAPAEVFGLTVTSGFAEDAGAGFSGRTGQLSALKQS